MEKIFQFFGPRKINFAAQRKNYPQNAKPKPNAISTKKNAKNILI